MAALGQGNQQVQAERVQLPEVHDHLVEAEIRICGKKVPAVNPASPNRSANVGRLEETLVDDELGFMNNGGRDCGNLSVREVARLSQNQDARRHTLNFTLPGKVQVVLVKNVKGH